MRNLKFPEIEKKVQQSIYGAWGSSNSNDPNGGYIDLDEIIIGGGGSGGGGGIDYYIPLDEVIVGGGGSGGGSGSNGGWDYGNNGSYDNGGYWGDSGGSGGGAGYELGDNFIEANNMLVFAQGHANTQQSHEVEDRIRSAVGVTGLAAGFTGTSIDAISAITKEIGFTAKTFSAVGSKIGVAGVMIGGVETYVAVAEAVGGIDPWTDADTLNAMATALGVAALVPGPHSIICGGLSIAIGLVSTAYSQ
ncbi:hypothetical protein [Flavobacterium sp.]|uniref:hypothetical protein n=1 Tax=Flavobacterium sp. TaxID=239 RepID=UPI003D0D82AE